MTGFKSKRAAAQAIDKVNWEDHEPNGRRAAAQDKLNEAIEPHTTTFHNLKSDWVMPDWVMRITADRRIEVNEGVEVTEAAQKVLDALQNLLKPAQPEQEPVLWMMPDGKTADKWALQFYGGQAGKPLYTTPPRRTWVYLTDEHIKEIVGPWGDTPIKGYTRKLVDQIEAKSKELNA